ncbi:MAG TPA: tRNA uracil 4-sulfurtransferase ThiI [Bacteroidota bacterium]|nr:tRNA uracil 4-sulfurtransferase ThiI [Bacteroidota bacterium]
MKPVIILHHHEIILKGDNRGFFERQLLNNLRKVSSGIIPQSAFSGGYGRFIVDINGISDTDLLVERLTKVFGIANVCSGLKVRQDVEEFCRGAGELLAGLEFKTIRVETKRADKNFPVRSMDVSARVGEYICNRFNVRGNMSSPDETIYISIVDGMAFVYLSKVQGAGGLPVGVSGRVVGLLSAGFDSPVACWQLIKRGANVIFVHFHSMPYTSQNSLDQVRKLAEILATYQMDSKLFLIPFAEVQQELILKSPQPLRVIMYRRFMIRIAEEIARREKAEALVTGESVGQVASQTLRNIRAIDEAAVYPILRPLSGMDKEETLAIARKIGTFDISKEPYDDCCSYLAPRKPATWARLEEVTDAEAALDVSSLVGLALSNLTTEHYRYPAAHRTQLAETTA